MTPAGERVAGTITAASQEAVLAELEARRLVPVNVSESAGRPSLLSLANQVLGGAPASSAPASAAPGQPGLFRRRISARVLATAYQQIADLLRAGVPLMKALRLLAGNKTNPRLATAFKALADAVAEGTDLGDAMAAQPENFHSVHVAMVRAGERGGFLEQVMARLAKLVDSQAEMRAKIIGNLVYPGILITGFSIVLGLIFGVFIPMFRPMFDRMQDQLGLLTHSVLFASTAVRSWGWLLLPLLALIVVAGAIALQRQDIRLKLERLRMRMPVIGPLARSIAVARFARVLGSMLHNSVPMLTALSIAKDAAGSPVLGAAIAQASEAVRAGQRLADPLAASGLFAEDVIEMIRVGEQANNLADVLSTIADTLEARVDRMLAAAIKLIEPLMLLVVALVVMWVAMALIVPMTRLGQSV